MEKELPFFEESEILDPEVKSMQKGPLRRFWNTMTTDPELSQVENSMRSNGVFFYTD